MLSYRDYPTSNVRIIVSNKLEGKSKKAYVVYFNFMDTVDSKRTQTGLSVYRARFEPGIYQTQVRSITACGEQFSFYYVLICTVPSCIITEYSDISHGDEWGV